MSRIAVVEPERGERLILSSRLEELNHEVVLCESDADALTHARSGELDLVLLSATPSDDVDGIELCRRLKAIPELGSAPVVVYASDATARPACERAYEAGCEAFLSKAQMPHIGRVVDAMLRIKKRADEVKRQNHALELENQRLEEERRKSLSRRDGAKDAKSSELPPAPSERPDGLLVVDSHGRVKQADRGAYELLGRNIEGKTLGSLVPASGLEAFVRDARTDARDGFRFDVAPRTGRPGRSLVASVTPVTKCDSDESEGLRIVLLLDPGKRRVAEEMLRQPDAGIPRHQLVTLMDAARKAFCPESIVGTSERIEVLRRRTRELSRTSGHVLVHGERGAGAEFLARVVHYSGSPTGSFLHFRCGALAPASQENEIFGHSSGDVAERPGLLLLASGGTLFLAGVDSLAGELQEKLYETLRAGEIRRPGATRSERVDARLIAFTHRDLEALVAEGRLHAGLFELLSENVLGVPPLREYLSDLPAVAMELVRRFGYCKAIRGVRPAAMWVMQQYHWPGNLAELEDCIERACGRASGDTIAVEDLPLPLRQLYQELPREELVPSLRPTVFAAAGLAPSNRPPAGVTREWDITDSDPIELDLYERKALLRALDQTGGDKLAAARLLKVGKSTLYRKLKRLGIR